jgi:acyl-CoA thioesterase-1
MSNVSSQWLECARRTLVLAAMALLVACLTLPATAATDDAPIILVVGDSISAGYGLGHGESWVDLLGARLAREGRREKVVNASISGDTTAGGRQRLPALLREYHPSIVVIELGGNDALRGGNLDATRANLDAMVRDAQAAHAKVLLVGMKVPPNYGTAYVRRFAALYGDVARARGVPLVPYMFEGFGEDVSQFQEDRIHPKASAEPHILDNVWPALTPLLSKR